MQIIVYTGAIMMLFLFVLMLTGRDAGDSVIEVLRGQRIVGTVLGIGFVGAAGRRAVCGRCTTIPPVGLDDALADRGADRLASPSCCSPTTCSRSS